MPVYRKLYEESMSTAIERLIFKPITPSSNEEEEEILMSGDAVITDDDEKTPQKLG